MKIMWGFRRSGGRVTATVSMAFGRTGSARPNSSQKRFDHAPAATITLPASMRPAEVSTPVTRLAHRSPHVPCVPLPHRHPGRYA